MNIAPETELKIVTVLRDTEVIHTPSISVYVCETPQFGKPNILKVSGLSELDGYLQDVHNWSANTVDIYDCLISDKGIKLNLDKISGLWSIVCQ